MRSFNADRALADATDLSFPRLVGAPAEVRARKQVRNRLADAGLDSTQIPFYFYPALAFGILRNLVVLGGLLLIFHRVLLSAYPRIGALLGLAVPLIGKSLWNHYRRAAAGKLDDMTDQYPRHAAFIPLARVSLRSGNVIADLPAQGEIRHRLVLSAHTDSKSQNMSIVTRIVSSVFFGLGIFLLPLATAPGLLWPGWLTGISGGVWWTFSILAILGAIVLATLKVTDESPGATDNAGSCGLLLETARALAADPPRGVAVRLVFTGAEELGLAGGYAYARQASADDDWRNAIHLNFEGVGGGHKLWYTSETGPTGSYAGTGQAATELFLSACQKAGLSPKRLGKIIGGEADHIPLVEAGLSAVTAMFGGKQSTAIHTAGDHAGLLEKEAMAEAGKLALAAVDILEKRAS